MTSVSKPRFQTFCCILVRCVHTPFPHLPSLVVCHHLFTRQITLIGFATIFFWQLLFFNNEPNFTGWRLTCNWIWRAMWLRALVNRESWQFASVSLSHTHRFCAPVMECRGSPLVCVRGRLVSAHVARDVFVCISRAYCLDRENENGWDCNYWMEISTQCEIRKGWAKTSHGHRR